MTGYLNIRNDVSDAKSVVLTLDSKGEGGTSRMGKTLEIDIGRSVNIKLPNFLLDDQEIKTKRDDEPVDQKLERQAARIKQLEALEHNKLVIADETDNARMQELTKALNKEQTTTKSLNKVLRFVEDEFHRNVESAEKDAVEEILRRHKVEGSSKSDLKAAFDNADPETKVHMLGATRSALNDEQTVYAASQHHNSQRHLQQDKDAARSIKFHGGPESTTDQHFNFDRNAQSEEGEYSTEEEFPELQHGSDSTTERSDLEDRPVVMEEGNHNMQASDDEHSPTGHQPSENTDDTHQDTQEKADEALEAAHTASDAAEESARKAQETQESVNTEHSEEDGTYKSTSGEESNEDNGSHDTQQEEDDFRSNVNKLRKNHLDTLEETHTSLQEANSVKEKKDLLKDKYENADNEGRKSIAHDVESVLEV